MSAAAAVPPGGMPPGLVPLHVVWPRPGMVLGGIASVLIWVDGGPVWRAPFEHGVDVTVPVSPGRHRLDVRIDLEGVWARNRSYELEVPGPMHLELRYSRWWGNFKKKLAPRSGG